MTIHDRLPMAHGITERADGLLHSYWGKCSCGWSGPMRRNDEDARRDVDEHQASQRTRAEQMVRNIVDGFDHASRNPNP